MRVQFRDDGDDPDALPNLRWRGIVFDHFDGRTWSVGAPDRRVLPRLAGRAFIARRAARARPRRAPGRLPRSDRHRHHLRRAAAAAARRARRRHRPRRHGHGVRADRGGAAALRGRLRARGAPPPGTRVSAAGAALVDNERERFLQLPPHAARHRAPGARGDRGEPRSARGGESAHAVPRDELHLQPRRRRRRTGIRSRSSCSTGSRATASTSRPPSP